MDVDCVHYKNVLFLSCWKKKLKKLIVQNVLSADAVPTEESTNQAFLENFIDWIRPFVKERNDGMISFITSNGTTSVFFNWLR